MRVLMISPGFPADMPRFTRALASVGAEVIGLGDQPAEALPAMARHTLSDHVHVGMLWDEDAVIAELLKHPAAREVDRVECLWEPGMMLAARIRETLELPGLDTAKTLPFRDKEAMKQVLDEAGIRTPKHARARSEKQRREAAEKIGYPLVIKPIAGAGSADTHVVSEATDLDTVLERCAHVDEVSVEEFIDGEEYTYDTITAEGKILYYNISWYRPRPLIARSVESLSPQTICLREVDSEDLGAGRAMGRAVIDAMGFETGFTHMEWFKTSEGEAVFGEIGGRPPGACSVEIMNYAEDADLFLSWAEAIVFGRCLSGRSERLYNAAVVFKRAEGSGRIRKIEGLDDLLAHHGDQIMEVALLSVGQKRRDWMQTLLSDGYLILRDAELDATLALADKIGSELRLFAE